MLNRAMALRIRFLLFRSAFETWRYLFLNGFADFVQAPAQVLLLDPIRGQIQRPRIGRRGFRRTVQTSQQIRRAA